MSPQPYPTAERMSGRYLSAFSAGIGIRAVLFALILVALPLVGHAEQDYSGIWESTVTVSIDGQRETGSVADVFFHEGDSLLLSGAPFCEGLSEGTRLNRVSSSTFAIAGPVSCSLLGVSVTLTSYSQTFGGPDSFTGTASGTASEGSRNFAFSVSIRGERIAVTALAGNQTVSGLSGSEDSAKVFRINLPTDTNSLTIQTSGGIGDPDLEVISGRPPFDNFESDDDGTQESVEVNRPDPGPWYIVVYGWESYRDVSLSVSHQASSPDPTPPNPPVVYDSNQGVLGLAQVAIQPGAVQFRGVQIELDSEGRYRILAAQASSSQRLNLDSVPVFDGDNRILSLPRVIIQPGNFGFRDVDIWLGENGTYQILIARPE